MTERLSAILDSDGRPFKHMNGKPRAELARVLQLQSKPPHERRQEASYDAARTSNYLKNYWANADHLDADSSNSREVRHELISRSRYETGSNGYYDGIIGTHCNMLVGVGPTLRMLTGNRTFNQLVEREFYAWAQAIQLRRKLWCMSHAYNQDGEVFGLLQTNPAIRHKVQLDMALLEAEQVQTPLIPWGTVGYIDGIRFDEFGNVLWYDILPIHPGSTHQFLDQTPQAVAARNVLHWYKLKRPGAHRGVPSLTSTLNVGAASRRHREATVGSAEFAASLNALIHSNMNPAGDDEPVPVSPFSTVESTLRSIMALPMGWKADQMKGEHPNAQYKDFHRLQISEQAAPIAMPYNVAAHDSSTYSFASGKLDTLAYRAALDVERQDANDLVLDPLFGAWFREWTVVADRRDIIPNHQWDWPLHPVIDAVAEAAATDTRLKNGTTTLRQVYSDAGMDLEDQLSVMAEDYYGVANDETIAKMRDVLLRTHYANAGSATESAAPEGDVAKSALNGAQVASLVDILDRVARKTIPIDSAAPTIAAAFPTLSAEQIEAMVAPLRSFAPAVVIPPAAPPTPTSATEDETNEETDAETATA